jgi:phosphinothricin acetyltransferase
LIYYDNEFCGFCGLKKYSLREAYNQTAEISVYLTTEYQKKGIGNIAIKFLEKFAKNNDFHVLLAIICEENTGSIRLFEKNNYKKVGHFKEVGNKFDRFLDVVYYQKIL